MNITVFTPTRQYGLDVTYNALLRQKGIEKHNLLWIVGDDLYNLRKRVFEKHCTGIAFHHFDTQQFRTPTHQRTLAHAYNHATDLARAFDSDLFISLQDYIIPPDLGIAKFVDLANEHPFSLLTGLMSFSTQPTPDKIVNRTGLWSVFAEEYKDIPPIDGWLDIRTDQGPGVTPTVAIRWETNWAAIPGDVLKDERLQWNVEFDAGAAYENQDFAMQASALGYQIYLDCDNYAVGLPHKTYWPEQEQAEMPLTQRNLELLNQLWSA